MKKYLYILMALAVFSLTFAFASPASADDGTGNREQYQAKFDPNSRYYSGNYMNRGESSVKVYNYYSENWPWVYSKFFFWQDVDEAFASPFGYYFLKSAASELGLSISELRNKLDSGQTIDQIGKSMGFSDAQIKELKSDIRSHSFYYASKWYPNKSGYSSGSRFYIWQQYPY